MGDPAPGFSAARVTFHTDRFPAKTSTVHTMRPCKYHALANQTAIRRERIRVQDEGC